MIILLSLMIQISQAETLTHIIDQYTENAKRVDAFMAPYYNVEENLSKFGDFPSPEFFKRKKELYVTALEKLNHLKKDTLSHDDRKTYDIFKEDMEVSLDQLSYPNEYLSFNQMDNRLHSYLDDSSKELTQFPFDSVKHYNDFIKRSEGFPAFVDNQIELFKKGVKAGITLNCPSAKATVNTYQDGLESNIEKNPFYRPVTFMPESFNTSDKEQLKADFKKMIIERIIPGFKKFDHFFKKSYLPHCRKSYGLKGLPHARKWYSSRILSNTNLHLTAEEIHKTGLREVARISKGIEEIKNKFGFKGNLKAFLKSLTSDDKYVFKSAKEMFEAFELTKSLIAAKVPQYFSKKPKTDYKLVETSNPEDAAGSYFEPTENIPMGRFIVNTKNLHNVPIYEVTTLLVHEATPGHHFQLALQFEMKSELSEYRRKLFGSNAFVEGWALYSEYLGNEMGLFNDPMQKLGNLNDEMLRAVRLVVDTGIHHYGWSREKTIAYMDEHLATGKKDISNEANRYSIWPGQALGYKIGQLKIIELRKMAESKLGSKFDIKDFHSVVIGEGTLSLNILELRVKDWVKSKL
ncbi:MAG: DUF885 domain-containing protein [Xanthomonadaceae bacterium]|nr:DUF885 domain-containing protein [Xanthomonadaceae bacterium]